MAEMVEVTSMNEPAMGWSYADPAGHEHRWVGSWQHSELPTCVWVWDEPENPESDYPRLGHYACTLCGDVVSPMTQPSPCQRFIPGWP